MDSPGNNSVDTEQELRELYAALDERDEHIANLEREINNGSGATDVLAIREELDEVSAELEKNQNELIKSRDAISEQQVLITQLRTDNRELLESKEILEEEATANRSQVDTLRSELSQHAKASEDVKRLRKDGSQQLQRLEIENQRLRETIHEIEENEDILVNEIETLVKEKSTHQERCEDLTTKCDLLYAEIDEKNRINADLATERNKLQNDLESEKTSNIAAELLWKKQDADCRLELTKLKEELEREKSKDHNKEYESNKLELAKVRKENQRLLMSFQQCQTEKNQVERDLDSAIKALNQSKADVKEEVALVARKEFAVTSELNRLLKKAEDKQTSLIARCSDLEEQLEDVHSRLKKSEQRNSKYEENHGLSEAVRHQKKLEADIRRRDYDIKQLNQKLSSEIERRRASAKAVELIKEKANLGSDFELDNEEIRATLLLEDNVLRSENSELLRQIEVLEGMSTFYFIGASFHLTILILLQTKGQDY